MPEKQLQIEKSLTHHDQVHIQTYRDFLHICDYKKYKLDCDPKEKPSIECMAKLLRYFEYERDGQVRAWQIKKLNGREKNIPKPDKWPIHASVDTLIAFATIYTDGETTIRKSLTMLENLGYITRSTQNGKTTVFELQIKKIQQRLNEEYAAFTTSSDLTSSKSRSFEPPQNSRGSKSRRLAPQNHGGDLSLEGSKNEEQIISKEDYNNNNHHDDHNQSDNPNGNDAKNTQGSHEEKLTEGEKMVRGLKGKQKEIQMIFEQSEPLFDIQVQRFQEKQIKLHQKALDYYIKARIDLTVEELVDQRRWLESGDAKIPYFKNGGQVNLWDHVEYRKKYLAWKNESQAPTYTSSATSETTASDVMTQEQAQALAVTMVAQMDAAGYTGAQSFAEVRQDGSWIVRMKWGRNTYRARNQVDWNELFTETDEYQKSKAAQRQKVSN